MHPVRPLTRLEITRALRWAIWDAGFVTVYLALTGGAFQTGFARQLGATDLWLGIMTALPSISGGLQILAAYVGEHTANRRTLVLRTVLLSRLPWVIIAFLPLMAAQWQPLPLFVGLLTLSALLGSFAGPAYLAWLSDLVPPDSRGRYFGRRNMILGLVSAIAALPPALFLDQAVKYHRLPVPYAFSILFGLGTVCLFLSFAVMGRLPDIPREPPKREGWGDFFRFYHEPLRDRAFRQMMLFFVFWTAGQLFPGQFFTVYMLEQLKLPYTWIQILAVIASLGSSLGMPFWGYLSDKFGNKPLLIISGSGVVSAPLLWILATPEQRGWTLGVLIFIQVTAGFLWAGVGLSSFNLILNVAPEEQRTIYMGAVSAIGSLVGGVAPLLSGLMMQFLHPHLPDETRFHLLFLMTALLRAFALLWLRGLREPRGVPAAYVLSQLRSSTRPRGWMALRRLTRGQDEESRVEAARTLAEVPTPLAVEELVRALQDPSPDVRRQAAIALGEIGDARALEPLLQVLRDPASDLTLEAIEAIGKIGRAQVVPELVVLLKERRAVIRMAIVRALQQIGSPTALAPLLESLPGCETPDEQSVFLKAIAHLLAEADTELVETLHPSSILLPFLHCESAEVRAEAAGALARLPPQPIASILRLQIEQESNAAVLTALASALATHGTKEDTEQLVQALARSESLLARQQIALAIAQLWGSRDRLYLLLTADDVSRDQQVERLLEPFLREHPAITDALRAYAYGDYSTALQTLLQTLPDNPLLQHLRHAPPQLESWLIAVAGV